MKKASAKKSSLLSRLIWSKHSFLAIIILALVLPLTLAVMGQQQTLTQHAATTRQINLLNFTANPQTITITQGDTIEWTNMDVEDHQMVSDTGVFQSPVLSTNQKWSFTFNDAGTFVYHCAIHPAVMNGFIITVTPNANFTISPTVSQPTPTGVNPTFGCVSTNPCTPTATMVPTATTVPVTIQPTSPVPTTTSGPGLTNGAPTDTPQPGITGGIVSPTSQLTSAPSDQPIGGVSGIPATSATPGAGGQPGGQPGVGGGGFIAFLLALLLAILQFFMKLIGKG